MQTAKWIIVVSPTLFADKRNEIADILAFFLIVLCPTKIQDATKSKCKANARQEITTHFVSLKLSNMVSTSAKCNIC